MNDFVLDRPQVIDYHDNLTSTYLLANQDICVRADAHGDLQELFWPWVDGSYARSVQIHLSAPREDEIIPMVTRLYPGHIETISGTDGVIVTKQLVVPLGSSYDRSAIWLYECQAEGDRLLRLDIEIDWGEPLKQRMVDGLLVAQMNPGPAQGIYDQQNAESTRVFGNPEGRPDFVDIDDPCRARLVYHVLINGEVEVQFLLTMSDVGEQVAWNGFLALRDAAKVAEKSHQVWHEAVSAGRLWTPDADLNRAVHASRILAIRSLQRVRSGLSPVDRWTEMSPQLVDAWDIFDPVQSRNLLAHLRRIAEKTNGRLPIHLPLRRKDIPDDPKQRLVWTNGSYLLALERHLSRRFDADLLAAHYTAVGLVTEMLLRTMNEIDSHQHRTGSPGAEPGSTSHGSPLGTSVDNAVAVSLKSAVQLARWAGDVANARRWATHLQADSQSSSADNGFSSLWTSLQRAGWNADEEGVWSFTHSDQALLIASQAIWECCGISVRHFDRLAQQTDSETAMITVNPSWPANWTWWAMMDLPIDDEETLSMVWDGQNLHTNHPINTTLPVIEHQIIRSRNTDEDNFSLDFVFIDGADDDEETRSMFKPEI